MAKVEMEPGVVGAILIKVGDRDGDGEYGISAQVFGDIPWDSEDSAVPLLDLPEVEFVSEDDLAGALSKILGLTGSILGNVLKLVRLS